MSGDLKEARREGASNISTVAIIKALAIVLFAGFLWYVRDIVSLVLIALLLAALIEPFAGWLKLHKIPRGFGVIIIYVALALFLAAIFLLIIPPLIDQITLLLTNLGFSEQVSEIFSKYKGVLVSQAELLNDPTQVIDALKQVFNTVSGFLGALAAVIVVAVLAFYMVVEEEVARRFFKNFAPVKYQSHMAVLFTKMQSKIGLWLRGQLVLAFAVGLLTYIGLLILGIDYALVLALMTGFLEVIPYAGPVIAAVPAVILAFTQAPIKGVMVLILYFAIQQVENNLLTPKIMQKVTGLNPVVSIVALMIGIKLGGLVGALLAIPVATMVVVILEDIYDARQKEAKE